jgi:hypothetical protein
VRLFDVEEIPTHGGSLRIYGCHAENPTHRRSTGRSSSAVERGGLDWLSGYATPLPEQVRGRGSGRCCVSRSTPRRAAPPSLRMAHRRRATRWLNYAGVGTDIIDFTVDRSPHKQGFAPSPAPDPDLRSRSAPSRRSPEYLPVLPWNPGLDH